MEIKKDDIFIRNAIISDANTLLTWWNDGKVMEHAGFPLGLQTTESKVLEKIYSQSDEFALLIIEFKNEVIGEMNFKFISESAASIGIKICDIKMQNQGIGSICLRLLIDSLFDGFNLEKIVLDTNLNNLRAQKVYEKLGFTKIKTEIDSWKNQIGELQSVVYYELYSRDWHN